MPDISLLPEEMRGKEEEVREGKPAEKAKAGGLVMHVPDAVVDEDIEIIEVDEGDLAAVLSDEPFMTRMTYRLSAVIDKVKDQLFGKKEAPPPPKLPPQFFKPPKPGLVTKAPPLPPGAKPEGVRPPAPGKPKARITPQAEVPRRVRIIRRVRKPVRVSLISAEELAALSIDVGKRKWTFTVMALVFVVIIGAGYYLISEQLTESRERLADAVRQLEDTRDTIVDRQEQWSQYEDLQDRLVLLDGILNGHVVISRMFDFLELRTLPTVAYRTAAWSSDGDLILDVLADTYEAAAQQLVVFDESEIVERFEATAFSSQVTGGEEAGMSEVNFQLILELDVNSLRGPLFVQESEDDDAMQEVVMPTAFAQ